MKIGLVVNDVQTEKAEYTTTRLAMTAVRLGHECWEMGVGDFVYSPDETIHALARTVKNRKKKHASLGDFLAEMQSDEAEARIAVNDLDVLVMRYDPAEDKRERPWAQTAGILFGELAVSRGVIVVNEPRTLATAINKTYFQQFPEIVRPRTCISRNIDEIKQFITEQQDKVVIKPLQGSGGQSVFLIREDDAANLNQMIEAVIRDGYCIVQEYLPRAAEGDVRLFVMNGRPLMRDGKYAAFRRVNKSGDMRSNMHSGGEGEAVEVTDEMLALVEAVRPKLVRDGMFLVGLDVVGDKLMEINVFTPGGLGSAAAFAKVDFTESVIEALEQKVNYRRYYGAQLDNRDLATL
jgi:glutathione synthase